MQVAAAVSNAEVDRVASSSFPDAGEQGTFPLALVAIRGPTMIAVSIRWKWS